CLFFFFQAEDGIRDFHVTGVQTCALPIYNTQQNSLFVDYEGNLELGHIDSSDNLADRCVRRCECQSPVSHFPARFSSMEQTRRERRTHGASESLRVSHDQG